MSRGGLSSRPTGLRRKRARAILRRRVTRRPGPSHSIRIASGRRGRTRTATRIRWPHSHRRPSSRTRRSSTRPRRVRTRRPGHQQAPYQQAPYQPAPAHQPAYPGAFPPPPTHQYAQPPTGNGKAIAALILGVLSIILFFLSILDIPLFVLGIVFGILGIKAANRGAGGKGMATAGLVCAIIGALCCVVFTGFIVKRVVDCGNKYDTGTVAYDHCVRNGS